MHQNPLLNEVTYFSHESVSLPGPIEIPIEIFSMNLLQLYWEQSNEI